METGTVRAIVVRFIWLAFLASICVYGVVTLVFLPETPPTPFARAFSNLVIPAIYGMGAIMLALSFIIPPIVVRGPDVPASMRAPADPSGEIRLDPRTRYRLVLRWTLIESAAIFGLMASYIASDTRLFFPLGALAIAGMLLSYPSDAALREMVKS